MRTTACKLFGGKFLIQPWEEIAAFVVSLFAMVLIASGYFFEKKSVYLFCQAAGIVGISLSYFFTKEFFAMIGLGIGLVRTLVFYGFEKRDKPAPIYLASIFASLSLLAYLIVNVGVLHSAKPVDLLCLAALILYAFIFRIRDMKKVRYLALIPAALSIAYNLLVQATVFVVLSYAFEFASCLVSIFKQKEKNE